MDVVPEVDVAIVGSAGGVMKVVRLSSSPPPSQALSIPQARIQLSLKRKDFMIFWFIVF